MAWRVVKCLLKLDQQIRALCPRAVPPATDPNAWGTRGDVNHDPTSDHSPHDYPGLGTEVVCAHDFPHAPALGMDGGNITERLRLSRDPRIGYVIFNRRIFSGHVVDGVPAYTWRVYTGSDPHDTHFHVSSVHTAIADNDTEWNLGGTTMAIGDTANDVRLNWGENLGPYLHRIEPMWTGNSAKLDKILTLLTAGTSITLSQEDINSISTLLATGVVAALHADPNVPVDASNVDAIAAGVAKYFGAKLAQ